LRLSLFIISKELIILNNVLTVTILISGQEASSSEIPYVLRQQPHPTAKPHHLRRWERKHQRWKLLTSVVTWVTWNKIAAIHFKWTFRDAQRIGGCWRYHL